MEPPAEARLSFDRVADVYDEVRPPYPGAMFDELFRLLPPRPEVMEVGTGQATRDLLARGASVHAVEIGAAMADRLEANLAGDGLRVTVGDFERVPVEAGSADAVFSATAREGSLRTTGSDPHSRRAPAARGPHG